MIGRLAALAALALLAGLGVPTPAAWAQGEPAPAPPPATERPSESEIFGAPAPESPPPEPPASRDEAILGARSRLELSDEVAPEDPLRIGGFFYLRAQSSARQGQSPDAWTLSAPSLLDVYLDARPNQRVRGFVLGRMVFDPTLPEADNASLPTADSAGAGDTTMGVTDLASLLAARDRGPIVALDQLWIRFDIGYRVFVTAGKQHVRWGTGRFWSPGDFLHRRPRNPLDLFDARTGTTMLKLHLPWEDRGWNFYAYAVLEDREPTPKLSDASAAARAEIVLGTTELGAAALVQGDQEPRIEADLSTALWDVDLHAELALRAGEEIDRVSHRPENAAGVASPAGFVDAVYPVTRRSGWKAQVVAGASYARQYDDDDVINLGAEYFYNPLGYADPDVYPGLLAPRALPLQDAATFFYLGRHYGAVFLNLPAPYGWDLTTFTLSTIANLSDRSFITRLDYGLDVLTHLRFEAFVAIHGGRREGEFRFGIRDLRVGGFSFSLDPGLLDVGVALRMSI